MQIEKRRKKEEEEEDDDDEQETAYNKRQILYLIIYAHVSLLLCMCERARQTMSYMNEKISFKVKRHRCTSFCHTPLEMCCNIQQQMQTATMKMANKQMNNGI